MIFSYLLCLGLSLSLWGHENEPSLSSIHSASSGKSLFEVASLGAPTTGPLIEGSIGCKHKGSRIRFYCVNNGTTEGFLGPQTIAKPISLKDQPGIFPAPLMGPSAVSFTFHCQNSQDSIIPVVIKPDGTVFNGMPMTSSNSPQSLLISAPAQTGIYTLFALPHRKDQSRSQIVVDASINTQPHNDEMLFLKTFDNLERKPEEISAEFIYIPS